MSAGTLIEAISTTGSSTAAGLPNVNGQVFAYVPGTTTPTTIYSDAAATIAVAQPVVLDNAGRVPYATYPNGLYCTGPIRLFIQDVNGSTVSDTTYQWTSGLIAVSNTNFTGTTLDAILNAAGTSFGGQDFKYLGPGSGAVARTVKGKFQEIEISVVDQGADPTGAALSTTAIQNAVNAVIAMGGGIVYFPPGTYKINAAITLAANTGVTLRGAGVGATSINQVTSSTDAFTVSNSSGFTINAMTLNAQLSLINAANPVVDWVTIGSVTSAYGLSISKSGGSNTGLSVRGCNLQGQTAGVNLADVGGNPTAPTIRDTAIQTGGTISLQVSGSTGALYVSNCAFTGATAVKFASGLTGVGFTFVDCPTIGGVTTPFDASALSGDPGINTRNVGMDFILQDNLIADAGHTYAPNALYGTTEFRVTTASGGASVTIGTPTPAPGSSQKGKVFSTYHVNNSGSGVTWVFPASAGQYLTNVSIPTANNTKFNMSWKWDGVNWNLNSTGQAV